MAEEFAQLDIIVLLVRTDQFHVWKGIIVVKRDLINPVVFAMRVGFARVEQDTVNQRVLVETFALQGFTVRKGQAPQLHVPMGFTYHTLAHGIEVPANCVRQGTIAMELG